MRYLRKSIIVPRSPPVRPTKPCICPCKNLKNQVPKQENPYMQIQGQVLLHILTCMFGFLELGKKQKKNQSRNPRVRVAWVLGPAPGKFFPETPKIQKSKKKAKNIVKQKVFSILVCFFGFLELEKPKKTKQIPKTLCFTRCLVFVF